MNEEITSTEPKEDVATRIDNEIKYLSERITELQTAKEILKKNPDIASVVQAIRYL